MKNILADWPVLTSTTIERFPTVNIRKVLIIADLTHASPRMPGIAKCLPEFGWEAIILTGTLLGTCDKKFRIIQTPFSDSISLWKKRLNLNPTRGFQEQIRVPLAIREGKESFSNKLITLIKGIIAYPDAQKMWKLIAIKAASEFLITEKINAMISSSSPVTSHIIAKELKSKYKIPWVADLRDLWTQNHNYPYGSIRRLFEKRLELKTLLAANALVTVSLPFAENLRALHRDKVVHIITNGFDPKRLNISHSDLTDKFTITYTGQIYTGKQDLSKLFVPLKRLISNGTLDPKDIEIRFYGPINPLIERETEKYGLLDSVRQYGVVEREMALDEQRKSHLLLLLNWEDSKEKGVYPGKIFEYLVARRPILSIGGTGNDVVEKLLEETQSGFYGINHDDIEAYLKRTYLEYKQQGKIDFKENLEEINKYNYRELAKKFAKVLDQINLNPV